MTVWSGNGAVLFTISAFGANESLTVFGPNMVYMCPACSVTFPKVIQISALTLKTVLIGTPTSLQEMPTKTYKQ